MKAFIYHSVREYLMWISWSERKTPRIRHSHSISSHFDAHATAALFIVHPISPNHIELHSFTDALSECKSRPDRHLLDSLSSIRLMMEPDRALSMDRHGPVSTDIDSLLGSLFQMKEDAATENAEECRGVELPRAYTIVSALMSPQISTKDVKTEFRVACNGK